MNVNPTVLYPKAVVNEVIQDVLGSLEGVDRNHQVVLLSNPAYRESVVGMVGDLATLLMLAKTLQEDGDFEEALAESVLEQGNPDLAFFGRVLLKQSEAPAESGLEVCVAPKVFEDRMQALLQRLN